MGLIKAIRDYEDTFNILEDRLNDLEKAFFTNTSILKTPELLKDFNALREAIVWLHNNKDDLLDAIDECLKKE